jgi:hypothetical protein
MGRMSNDQTRNRIRESCSRLMRITDPGNQGETPTAYPEDTARTRVLSRYWIGCTRTGSPHQAQVCDGRHWSALDTSTSRFVVDSGVPRFTE